MKAQQLCNVVLLVLCLGSSGHAWWALFLFLLSLALAIHGAWQIPGGFAWRGAAAAPPGPAGWPVLGSIPAMGALAHRRLAELAESYGATRLMALSLGSTRVVISSDPDTAREILCSAAFSDRPAKESARLLMFERAIGFAPAGEYWRRLRRLAATSLFCPRRIAAMEGLRQKVALRMIERAGEEMKMSGAVELRELLQSGSLESVLGSVFGVSLDREREKEVVEMVKEGYELIGAFNWGDHFPMGSLLDFHGVGRRCRKLADKVKLVVGELINERRYTSGLGEGNDFLSVLLSLPEEERISDYDMTAILWEMIFRGTDVVAIVLEWALARMVLHPEIQAKVQQEIEECLGGVSRPVEDADMPRLPYLQSVVKEVLRLHPPGPLLSWARLAIHDIHVGKVFVPAGTTAMVNMWAITHDGSIWKDPWAFRPERFMEDTVPVLGSDLRLAPFGAGRRVCPGRALGLATVNLWFARLLQSYSWSAARPVVLAEQLRLSMEMKKPLTCRVGPR
ncbi:cytochrome P450 78A5-like [Wolffia australiana]